jgi:[ribosomal protein S5]-alanine N-acetyltransferase
VSILETARLILRPLTEADAEQLFALDSDPEVMRYLGPRFIDNVEQYRERIRTVYLPIAKSDPRLGFFVVSEKDGEPFLGWFLLRPALLYRFATEAGFRDGDLEVGYRLARRFWGKGYATEVARVLVRRGFEAGAQRVVATALIANRGSTRVMEKVGLRRGNTFTLPGFDEPGVCYALTREEYDPKGNALGE